MAKKSSIRRVRCFFCNNLVYKSIDDAKSAEGFEMPYAIKTLRLNQKLGCICSDCVEKFSEELDDSSEYSADKYDIHDYQIYSSSNSHSSNANMTHTSSSKVLAKATEQLTPVTQTNSNAFSQEELETLSAKYSCLEYSTQSIVNLV